MRRSLLAAAVGRHASAALIRRRRAQVKFAARVVRRHTALPMRLRAYVLARSCIGYTEQGGNNQGPKVSPIIHYAGGDTGEPWCVDFVIWCYGHAGSRVVKPGYPRAVYSMRTDGLIKTNHPRRGHIVRYSFGTGHTGLFARWRKDLGAGYFEAIEGNTGSSGAVSDASDGHDGVKRKIRHTSQVLDFLVVVK